MTGRLRLYEKLIAERFGDVAADSERGQTKCPKCGQDKLYDRHVGNKPCIPILFPEVYVRESDKTITTRPANVEPGKLEIVRRKK